MLPMPRLWALGQELSKPQRCWWWSITTNAVMLSVAHSSATPMVAEAVADLEGLVAAGAVAMAMVQAVAMESAR